jgi:hypothetical protein
MSASLPLSRRCATWRSIQNAVLRAAFLAAETGSAVTEDLLFRAVNEEYHALGAWPEGPCCLPTSSDERVIRHEARW